MADFEIWFVESRKLVPMWRAVHISRQKTCDELSEKTWAKLNCSTIVTARNEKEALAAFERRHPDYVVMQVNQVCDRRPGLGGVLTHSI